MALQLHRGLTALWLSHSTEQLHRAITQLQQQLLKQQQLTLLHGPHAYELLKQQQDFHLFISSSSGLKATT